MKSIKDLSLPDRLLIVVIALMVIPFISLIVLIFMNYYFWDTYRYNGSEKIQAPKWLRTELSAILDHDKELLESIPPLEREIMLLTDADGDFLYVGFTDLIDLDLSAFSGSLPDLASSIVQLMTGEQIALTIYGYNDTQGLMAYMIRPDSFPQILARWLWILAALYFVACLFFPTYISTRLIMQLRRSVSRLEEAAKQVEQGHFSFELEEAGRRDELKPLTDAFRAMQLRLREEQDQKTRFLMAISHDLKTPLTSIKGYLEAIEDGLAENPETLKEYLSILQRKSEILENRIGSLIDFARMDTRAWKQNNNRPLVLNDLFISLMKDCKRDIEMSGRSLEVNIELSREEKVQGDWDLLYRAFENILKNAQAYSFEGNLIEFKAGVIGDFAEICISDNGPGITEVERELIFEPFYRGGTGRNRSGMGLGLSSADSVIRSHGGAIDYRDRAGGGSEFIIHLPLIL
ncbi:MULTISPECIES: HAMP domain-containing sensor histidine kinase [unclassified Oceanispirochaeta]|uniref:HAMP domain-containing sensor histidine kinase n=1 Tax=unclassified Oceanispirochaeta TaxID=2635722 RepID=UPI000E09A63F|nr:MULTISPECIES: HAMP domain-containing sensor histidine kinase [unclassified Oceanispirochaeta]MBF9018589.1 HAMP domain-containing histidine kinase [Oceanispirochaeta sp. M2]NPD75004.1 HAMP domain-containing histidine kinase [Oceanispirochaeta sp. M1]RDG29125.1 sensor histidine kinase [Oceanispirochaeta sp. M1]